MTHFIKKVIEQNFPIKTTKDVVDFFKRELEQDDGEPNLTLLSLVAGMIENFLASDQVKDEFPIIFFDEVNSLYKKFIVLLEQATNGGSGSAVQNATSRGYATREIIKKVSDVIWNSLIRWTNKKSVGAHLQSLYTLVNENKLDCFGTAFAVVAGCQILGYKDVHLAISEDHVWVSLFCTLCDLDLEMMIFFPYCLRLFLGQLVKRQLRLRGTERSLKTSADLALFRALKCKRGNMLMEMLLFAIEKWKWPQLCRRSILH